MELGSIYDDNNEGSIHENPLHEPNDNIGTEMIELKGKNADLESEVTGLKDENAGLRDENASLREQIEMMKADNQKDTVTAL